MRLFFLMSFSFFLVMSCTEFNDDGEKTGKKQRTTARPTQSTTGQTDDPKDEDNSPDGPQTPEQPKPTQESNPLLETAEFKEFKTKFDNEFAGFDALSPEILYQIIEAVPGQSTTWGCGLVQANMARAAASIAVGLPIEHQEVVKCNEVGDYPLLANFEPGPLKGGLDSFGASYETHNGKEYFRVGAAPNKLADYLNTKLASGIKATFRGENTLDRNSFTDIINANLKSGMPLIAMSIIDAKQFRSHYYSIVGIKAGTSQLLVLDTQGKNIDRLKLMNIEDFIDGMETDDFKKRLKGIVQRIEPLRPLVAIFKIKGTIPPPEAINWFANYNLISFSKK